MVRIGTVGLGELARRCDAGMDGCRPRVGLAGALVLAILAGASLLAGCGRLASIPADPPGNRPADYLESRPHLEARLGPSSFVITEPSSSILIYALGLLTVGVGVRFLLTRDGQRSRTWWGFSLVAWGIGALLAGTSYQAFAYEIKSAGREVSSWTSWWEVWYLLFTVASIDAMAMAVAHASTEGKARRRLSAYAAVNAAVYGVVCLAGAFIPDRFMVSFELMVLFTWPGYLVFFLVNARRHAKHHQRLDRVLVRAWVALFSVMAAYYAWLLAGIGEALWERGIWFSANDLLHAGLIGWMCYLGTAVMGELRDLQAGEGGSPVREGRP